MKLSNVKMRFAVQPKRKAKKMLAKDMSRVLFNPYSLRQAATVAMHGM